MRDKRHIEKNKPWLSSIGLALLLVAVGVSVPLINNANESSGFAVMGPGYALIGLWLLVIPLSFILGIVSCVRNESPVFLSRLLLVLCVLPVLYFIVNISLAS